MKQEKIAILWYGLEGQSTYRFLRAQWISAEVITILDKNEQLTTPEWCKSQLWTSYLDNLEQYTLIWRAPGITTTLIEQVTQKSTASLPFTSQTEYFLHHYTGKIIGITWTKGKSTISMLTYLALQDAGKNVLLAGNVGKPVLDLIDRDNPPEIVVYELSSFMIESVFTRWRGRKIDIAIFNTLYSTHTKEHGGYEAYARAKLLLLQHSHHALLWTQAASVISEQFPDISIPQNTELYGKHWPYSRHDAQFRRHEKQLFTDESMLLVGEHNRENACAVVGICSLLDIDLSHLQNVLRSFWWLEHRLEFVGTYQQIDRYNDAIATTPQATCAALDSFWSKIDTLFYGGILGEYDHQLVADKIRDYSIRNLILFPDTGELLFAFLDAEVKQKVNVLYTRSMHDAVVWAAEHTTPWSIALLSCWSPSFSVWSGFVEKGNLFKQEVRVLTRQ